MALLEQHLKEIQLCSTTISDLSFPAPKMFTNAILHTQDITALIRDVEPHERHLFSLAGSATTDQSSTTREGASFKGPRKNTAVAAVLGPSMADRLRHERLKRNRDGRGADIDVDLLLEGAQRLCNVYSLPGAVEKISSLRTRHGKTTASIEYYQGLVAEQATSLKQINRPSSRTSLYEQDNDAEPSPQKDATPITTNVSDVIDDFPMTEDDLLREEESIRELERKKQTLEERVTGMEKDLGGILG